MDSFAFLYTTYLVLESAHKRTKARAEHELLPLLSFEGKPRTQRLFEAQGNAGYLFRGAVWW